MLAWDPPHRFAFGWGGDEIHLELSRTEAGCRLVLLNVLVSADTAARNATGWYGCLGELDKVLQGIPSDGPHSQPLADFWPLHDAHVAAGLPHGAWIPDEVLAARPS